MTAPVLAQDTLHNVDAPTLNLNEDGVALQGYDPVLYHIADRARPGREALALEHEGATYYFSTRATQTIFRNNPERYAPAYGGWCAFGLAMDAEAFDGWSPGKYAIDPETFKVIDGKLHLFYNANGFNALEAWNKDEAHHQARADSLWHVLTAETP